MNNEIIYMDEPMELGKVVKDFLPSPDQLIARKNKLKVTLELNEETIRFFQAKAKKQNTSDQKIISILVNQYAQKR